MNELVCSSCGRDDSLGPVPLPDGRIVTLCPTCAVAAHQVVTWMEKQQVLQKTAYDVRHQIALAYLSFGAIISGIGVAFAISPGWGIAVLGAILALAGVLFKVSA